MFRTIGRTWNLAKLSAQTLMKDKELVLFPLMSFVAVALILGVILAIAAATGSFDRLQTLVESDPNAAASEQQGITLGDVTLYVLGFVAVTYAVVFFNAALIAAAIERLRGGDPNVMSGLRAVVPQMHNILGWAIISATVGLILQVLRSRTDNILGRIALSLVGGVWAYMTFFVVPMLVVRKVGPIDAIKQSGALFKNTWGEQFTANFGFGLFYLVAGLIAFVPAAMVYSINPLAGILVGVPIMVFSVAAIQAIEGIFKAALYEYAAEGVVPQGYESAGLDEAYGQSTGLR